MCNVIQNVIYVKILCGCISHVWLLSDSLFPLNLSGMMKAYYLRGKAHMEVWNEAEARQDFSRVLDLNPTMKKAVKKELAVLNMRMEEKNLEDKKKYKGMF